MTSLSPVTANKAGQPPGSPDDQQILAQFERRHGFVPKALRLLAQRPEALPDFLSYGKGIFEGGPLSDRERYLVALSAGIALKSPDCIRAHSHRARQAGATEAQVVQTAMIAALVSHGSALHTAYDSLAVAGR